MQTDVMERLNTVIKGHINVVAGLIHARKLHNAYINLTYGTSGITVTTTLNSGEALNVAISLKEMDLSEQDWATFLENPQTIEGGLYTLKGDIMALPEIFTTQWVATGVTGNNIKKVIESLKGVQFVQTIKDLHSIISPHIEGDTVITILKSKALTELVYDARNPSMLTRAYCERHCLPQKAHVEWEVLMNGVPKSLYVTANDTLFKDVELTKEMVGQLLHLYGNILAAFFVKDTTATFTTPRGVYRFVKNQKLKPRDARHALEIAVGNALGEHLPSDMIPRWERVKKVMPHLKENGVRIALVHKNLPVFIFETGDARYKLYVGMNFILRYDTERRDYVEMLNLRKGHTLEMFSDSLRKLGVPEVMQVFVQALHLNRRLPNV